jgi:HlyD family secretion protein
MRGTWVLFAAIVFLIAAAAGALSVLRQSQATAPPQKQAAAAEVKPEIGDEITVMGKLQAAHIVPIPSPTDGVVDTWEVEEGQEVLEGQLLGHVSNSNLEALRVHSEQELERVQTRLTSLEGQIIAARLEAARAEGEAGRTDLEAARLEKVYARQQMLFKEGATPRLTYEKSEREYKTAQDEAATAKALAQGAADRVQKLENDVTLLRKTLEDRNADLERAMQDMESTNILAPADGMILKLAVDVGSPVDKAVPDLVQLVVDPSLMEVVIEPDPPQLLRIKPGQPALVLVPDVSSEGLPGQVKEIQDTRVIIEFTSPNPAIKHGMTASARIKLT